MDRKIKRIIKGHKTQDGAGVKLTRVFANMDAEDLDPFLLLDFFDTDNPEDYLRGFPWHPHRGIETVTYFIDGEVEHQDSLGNEGRIGNGDCQWMTAGSGIIHQEMPQKSPSMLGVQLWVNLSKKDKMIDPAYRDIPKKEIIEIKEENSNIKIIAGDYKGINGPIKGREDTNPNLLDISIDKNSEFIYEIDDSYNLFVFVIDGEGKFEDNTLDKGNGVLYGEGDRVRIEALEEGLRLLIFSGKPLNEPIVWGGPIVMNTKEEINMSFKELDNDTFIKKESKFISDY